jgi:penicillin-binding protein 2
MEKFLNDTIQEKSKADLERIANTNLMPAYLKRLQFIEDSTRARKWFETTKDSAYLKRYAQVDTSKGKEDQPQQPVPAPSRDREMLAILADRKQFKPTPLIRS